MPVILWDKPKATLEDGKRLVAEFEAEALRPRRKTSIDFDYGPLIELGRKSREERGLAEKERL